MGNEQENLNPEAQAAEMADDTQAQAAMAEVGADVEGLKARIAELEDAFCKIEKPFQEILVVMAASEGLTATERGKGGFGHTGVN